MNDGKRFLCGQCGTVFTDAEPHRCTGSNALRLDPTVEAVAVVSASRLRIATEALEQIARNPAGVVDAQAIARRALQKMGQP